MNMNQKLQKILRRAQQNESAGQFNAALKDYKMALHAAPDSIHIHHLVGLFFIQQNQFDYAKKQFNNVLALDPSNLRALFYSGLLHLNDQELEPAEKIFRSILDLEPEHVQTIVNLGVIALKRDQAQTAINHFTQALAIDPSNLAAKNNLAATFMHHDRFEAALVHYQSLLADEPSNAEYNYNAGVAQMALGQLELATKHFENILTNKNTLHGLAYNNLAAIKLRLGQNDLSIKLLEHAIQIDPHDDASKFMRSALTKNQQNTATCTTYVGNLFDNYALYYDHHLKQVLQSILPEQMVAELHQLGHVQFDRTLDLGCGTGLSGIVLRELSSRLEGVDLSTKMLSQARSKDLYDRLTHAEIENFFAAETGKYNLIFAADVLPYIGDLEPLIQQIHLHLADSGLFVFNVEISQEMPWHLQESIRFSHHQNYIHELCKRYNLNILVEKTIPGRQHNHKTLNVLLYVLELI